MSDSGNSDSSNNIAEYPTDSQSHVLLCPAFSDLRENMDLEDDRELVEFFKSVVERRIKNGEDWSAQAKLFDEETQRNQHIRQSGPTKSKGASCQYIYNLRYLWLIAFDCNKPNLT